MNSSFRKLLSGSAVLLAMLAFAAFAQQPPVPAEKSEPAPAPADAAPAASPAPPPSADAAAPAAAAEPEKPASAEPPLRRIDEPGKKGTTPRRIRGILGRHHGGSSEFPIGDHVVQKDSQMRDAVSILGSTTVEGEVTSDAVSVLGDTTIGPEAKVGGAAVAVLGRLVSEGDIRAEAVSVLGGLDINGHVGGEAVSVLGNLTLGPKAIVDGDLVLVGGELKRDPDAIVHGNLVNVPVTGFVGSIEWLTTWVKRCLLFGRPLAFGPHLGWAWGVAFAFLAFYLMLALLFGRAINTCVETFETRPGSSILAALLTVMLSPVAIILLAVTVVGALLIPFLGAGLMFAGLFGKAVMLAWIGRRILRVGGEGGRLAHPFFSVLVGGLLVMLLYTIWGSFMLYKLLGWVGLGVVVYRLALTLKREKPATATAGAGKLPPPPPGPRPPPIHPVMPGAPASGIVANAPLATPPPMTSVGFVGMVAPVEPPPPLVPPVPPTLPAPGGVVSEPVAPSAPVEPGLPPPAANVPAPPAPLPPAVVISAATLPRAGFFVRLAAMVLDLVLVGFVFGFGSHFVPRMLRFDFNPGNVLLVLAAYAAVMWKLKGTTIGGVICGLKVVRLDQRELDWVTAIVRAVSCFLSLCAAGLGFLWVAFDDEKQSWHDKIAGTTVVRVPKGVSLL